MAGVFVHLSNYWKKGANLARVLRGKACTCDRKHSSYRQTPMQTKLYSDSTERLIETAIKRLSLAQINKKR